MQGRKRPTALIARPGTKSREAPYRARKGSNESSDTASGSDVGTTKQIGELNRQDAMLADGQASIFKYKLELAKLSDQLKAAQDEIFSLKAVRAARDATAKAASSKLSVHMACGTDREMVTTKEAEVMVDLRASHRNFGIQATRHTGEFGTQAGCGLLGFPEVDEIEIQVDTSDLRKYVELRHTPAALRRRGEDAQAAEAQARQAKKHRNSILVEKGAKALFDLDSPEPIPDTSFEVQRLGSRGASVDNSFEGLPRSCRGAADENDHVSRSNVQEFAQQARVSLIESPDMKAAMAQALAAKQARASVTESPGMQRVLAQALASEQVRASMPEAQPDVQMQAAMARAYAAKMAAGVERYSSGGRSLEPHSIDYHSLDRGPWKNDKIPVDSFKEWCSDESIDPRYVLRDSEPPEFGTSRPASDRSSMRNPASRRGTSDDWGESMTTSRSHYPGGPQSPPSAAAFVSNRTSARTALAERRALNFGPCFDSDSFTDPTSPASMGTAALPIAPTAPTAPTSCPVSPTSPARRHSRLSDFVGVDTSRARRNSLGRTPDGSAPKRLDRVQES
jgi:hypothetical protein